MRCDLAFTSITKYAKILLTQKTIILSTRKSSCVNARGIPPAAYQVLAMLGGGTRSQVWGGTPSQVRGRGVPHPIPPRNCEQTDIPKYKYYLPSYYVRGR